jgi:S1-C subfamily serine protease
MEDNKQPAEDKAYTISSKSSRQPKTLSFTVPTLPRPKRPSLATVRKRSSLLVVGVILLGFLSGYAGAWLQNRSDNGVVPTSLSTDKKIVSDQSQLISQIVKTVGPSVVSVNVTATTSASDSSSSGYGAFGFSQPQEVQGAGTGVIISSSGIVLTNRHVVPAGTTDVSITLSDGTELKDVSVLGRTNSSDTLDVAFLKINNTKGHKLAAATIGDSSKVEVGDDVVAIGNALGQFQNTVTSGIISGYGRSVEAGDSGGSDTESLENLFQTDAAINQGNSGGPLVNMNGQVIGMNTATAGDAQNIGFAIPSNDIKGLVDQVLATGKFSRPYLGVRYIPLTADVASQYDLDVENGAFIAPSTDPTALPAVLSDSPAEKAGLKERDIITEVDGQKVDQTHSLTSRLNKHKPGDKVELTVLRDGKTLHISATLGTMPTHTDQ